MVGLPVNLVAGARYGVSCSGNSPSRNLSMPKDTTAIGHILQERPHYHVVCAEKHYNR